MRTSRDLKNAADRSAAEEIARVLGAATITLTARAGAEGKLFGSVTTTEISEAITAQSGAEIDRRHLELLDPIKDLGTHQVTAKLHSEVQFPITIEVGAPDPGAPCRPPRVGALLRDRVLHRRASTGLRAVFARVRGTCRTQPRNGGGASPFVSHPLRILRGMRRSTTHPQVRPLDQAGLSTESARFRPLTIPRVDPSG